MEIETNSESKHLKKLHLIRSMLTVLGLNNNIEDATVKFGHKTWDAPAVKPFLIKDMIGTPRKQSYSPHNI